mmetsp:Transcript_38776/g.82379  ORF Transcript_38776/g.82379 Transcript_38776/m.82379 type:complete len:204 (+) Transcript_38776:3219-3830(+)
MPFLLRQTRPGSQPLMSWMRPVILQLPPLAETVMKAFLAARLWTPSEWPWMPSEQCPTSPPMATTPCWLRQVKPGRQCTKPRFVGGVLHSSPRCRQSKWKLGVFLAPEPDSERIEARSKLAPTWAARRSAEGRPPWPQTPCSAGTWELSRQRRPGAQGRACEPTIEHSCPRATKRGAAPPVLEHTPCPERLWAALRQRRPALQ